MLAFISNQSVDISKIKVFHFYFKPGWDWTIDNRYKTNQIWIEKNIIIWNGLTSWIFFKLLDVSQCALLLSLLLMSVQ